MNNHSRIIELDSLRGLAALVVIFAHVSNYAPAPTGVDAASFVVEHWTTFFSGRLAVLLFFCISGFVLSYPYFSGSKPKHKLTLDVLNRLPRLFVPIFITGSFGFFLQWTVREFVPMASTDIFASSAWVQRWSVSDWDSIEAFRFLTTEVLFFYDRTHSFNINLWTMPVEFAFSMLVFAAVAMSFGQKIRAGLLIVIFVVLLGCWRDSHTVIFLRVTDGFQFFSGLIAAYLYSSDSLRSRIYSNSVTIYKLILTLGLIVSFTGGLLRKNGFMAGYLVDHLAAILIFFAFLYWCGKPSIFRSKLFIFFGYISFELYLIHGAVFYFSFVFISQFLPLYGYKEYLITSIVCMPLLCGLAYFLSAKVEAPVVAAIRKKIAAHSK